MTLTTTDFGESFSGTQASKKTGADLLCVPCCCSVNFHDPFQLGGYDVATSNNWFGAAISGLRAFADAHPYSRMLLCRNFDPREPGLLLFSFLLCFVFLSLFLCAGKLTFMFADRLRLVLLPSIGSKVRLICS
jgi:hypothetical protein